jgi:OOP family OmpA-OmpF porin
MKKPHRILATALAAGLAWLPHAVQAQLQPQERGFYAGGATGQSWTSMDADELRRDLTAAGVTAGDIDKDESGTAWKAMVGYQFNRHFAAELAYLKLADFSVSMPLTRGAFNGTGSAKWEPKDTFTLSALGILPLANRFSAFGKLGLYSNKLTQTITASAGGVSASESESARTTGLVWGLGLAYDLTRPFTIRVEWERLEKVGDEDKTGEGPLNFLSVGAVYRFQ